MLFVGSEEGAVATRTDACEIIKQIFFPICLVTVRQVFKLYNVCQPLHLATDSVSFPTSIQFKCQNSFEESLGSGVDACYLYTMIVL